MVDSGTAQKIKIIFNLVLTNCHNQRYAAGKPWKCTIAPENCTAVLASWKDIVLHAGIHHEKLFQVLVSNGTVCTRSSDPFYIVTYYTSLADGSFKIFAKYKGSWVKFTIGKKSGMILWKVYAPVFYYAGKLAAGEKRKMNA